MHIKKLFCHHFTEIDNTAEVNAFSISRTHSYSCSFLFKQMYAISSYIEENFSVIIIDGL